MPERNLHPLAPVLAALLIGGSPAPGHASPIEDETIGVATQEADGTIVLQLRTPSSSGVVGDALVRYPPDDIHYATVSRHVGPIPRGGSVFVKPFNE